MDKEDQLLMYSDPVKVHKIATKLLGKEHSVYLSTRKNKKYMVKSPDGKWIHFGEMGYEDKTLHGDEARAEKFRKRNARWAKQNKWSAGWLAYHILW
jgi:lipopolysaccharide export system protein LptA